MITARAAISNPKWFGICLIAAFGTAVYLLAVLFVLKKQDRDDLRRIVKAVSERTRFLQQGSAVIGQSHHT
jgi:hypothetical protein